MLMLSFIILFNALLIFSEKVPGSKEDVVAQRLLETRNPAEATVEYNLELSEKVAWEELIEKEKGLPVFINIFGLAALFIFSLGLFLDIHILMAKAKRREIIKAAGRRLPIRWGVRDIFKVVIIFVFLTYILHIVEAFIFLAMPEEKSTLPFIPFLNTGIMDLAILAFIIYFVKVKFGSSLAAIGLRIKDAARLAFLAVLGYIAFLPVLILLLLLLILLAALFNYHPPQQMLFKFFLEEEKLWPLIYSIAMVVILGPIVEEVFFRGFTYNAIKKRWGPAPAIMLTAVIFAGLHGTLFGFLPIMALGILLAYVYEKTDSLIPSITIHILHNSMMLGLLFMGRYFLQFAQ